MRRLCYSRPGALLLALLLQVSMEVRGWCLESSQCRDLTTESRPLECIWACKPQLSAETPVFPGNGEEQPLTENPRKYVMGHFRWDRFGRRNSSSGGGGVGQKREDVYPNGAEDESAEAFPVEFKRDLAGERPEAAPSPDGLDEGAAAQADLEYGLVAEAEKKDEGPYRMEHFRWGSPPKDKRYGGFMTSEKSQTPLVTLFRNAIIKNAHKKGQ
ncbi:Pro-opiomelanocortin [Tupaia chinensis]|uniref:Pro-opiomelanocortin n=1 Tax=Tupaia chinensis TaxID=246437 RepID=L8YFG0_TUPCH|nr:Pro-opiomelanocortin [Tupaia chinensis]